MFPELIHKIICIRESDGQRSDTYNSGYTAGQNANYNCGSKFYFCIVIKPYYIMSIWSLFYIELELGNKIHVYSFLTSSTVLFTLPFHPEIMSFKPLYSQVHNLGGVIRGERRV